MVNVLSLLSKKSKGHSLVSKSQASSKLNLKPHLILDYLKKMEMNPYKPIIQIYESFYKKSLSVKISLSKFNLKMIVAKVTT